MPSCMRGSPLTYATNRKPWRGTATVADVLGNEMEIGDTALGLGVDRAQLA